jgi:hypothetical protein
MNCFKCKRPTQVKDSRKADNNMVRRRRYCSKCKQGFFTLELMQHEYNKLATAPITEKIEVSKPIEPIRKRPPPRRNNDWDDLHSDDAFISLKDLGL